MIKRTAGPWEVVPYSEMVAPSSTHIYIRDTASEFVFAKVLAVGEGAANARLIAAAPEMLEALKGAKDIIERFALQYQGGELDGLEASNMVRICVAIGKAEGAK